MIPPLPDEFENDGSEDFVDDAVALRDQFAIALQPLEHVDVVCVLSDVEDSKILEVLMSEPFADGGPQGRFVKDGGARKPTRSRATGPDATGRVAEPSKPREKTAKLAANDDRVICFVKSPNPKKVGSKAHDAFELYKLGMTVAAFCAAGGDMGHIKWDSAPSRDFIRLCSREEWATASAETAETTENTAS